MLSAFEKKIGDFVISNGLMGPDDRVLLAVSGGADSTALLGVLKVLKDEGIVRAGLFCAHVNHQLRGSASDADEEFVLEQAAQLGLEVKTARVDVRSFARQNRLSIETAARQLRISSLIALAKDQGCNLIATGHQKDDNAETLIQRLSRGTGLRGLAGIRVVQDRREGTRFVRPMLCVRRSAADASLSSFTSCHGRRSGITSWSVTALRGRGENRRPQQPGGSGWTWRC